MEKNASMNYEDNRGARWWKFDFHAHTPASFDYKDGSESGNELTPEDWLKSYMQAEIDCVAVTDHSTGEWIDKLKSAYEKMRAGSEPWFRELFLFPGVEITVQGGIHLLAIYDPKCQTKDITALLGACGYPPPSFGKSDTCTSKSFTEVAAEITRTGGIAIPAHVDDEKGLFKEISDGNTLPAIFKSKDLFCCEVVDPSYKNLFPQIYRDQKVDWTLVYGSDAHRLADITQRLTWVKMGNPNLEGLKLALIDGENFSIRRVEPDGKNPNDHANLIIQTLAIKNGRYCGNDKPFQIKFTPWMNAIIGGRGTGKSSLVEFLRICMRRDKELTANDQGELKQYFEDFNKVPKNRDDRGMLRDDTWIGIQYCKDGAEFQLGWSQAGDTSPIEEIDDRGNTKPGMGDIPTRFPVRIYSQKQLYEIASTPQALLIIIDEALGTERRDWLEHWKNETNRFLSLRTEIRDLEIKKKDEPTLRGDLADVLNKIKIFESKDHASILKEFQVRENQLKEIKTLISSLEEMTRKIAELSESFEFPAIERAVFDAHRDRELLEIIDRAEKQIADRKAELARMGNEFAREIDTLETSIKESSWQKARRETTASYDALVKQLREAGVENPEEHGYLVQQKQTLKISLKSIENIGAQINSKKRQAEEILDKLFELRKELTEKRKAFVKRVLSENPYVRINIEFCGDVKSVEKDFREIIGKEEGFNDDILAADGERGLLAELVKGFSEQKLINLKKCVLGIKNGEPGYKPADTRFITFLQKLPAETFDRLDLWYPSDGVEVSYSRSTADKKFTPITQGSPGQKTAAILAFILSYGEQPIILDQPEDDLDNHLIYDLVVRQLKENKIRRQVIVVTHNPNIVINGDAEKVFALDFSGGQFRIKEAGCLQENSVRTEVCRIMEGGKTAFKQRYKRMNVEDIDA